MKRSTRRTLTQALPVRVKRTVIETNLAMGIGGGSSPFVDASGWRFSIMWPCTSVRLKTILSVPF